MHRESLRRAWDEVSEVALPIAELREQYLKLEGFKPDLGRFGQLSDVYENMNIIGEVLFQYLNMKSPMFGKRPDREVFMMARASIENAKIFTEVARGELELMQKNQHESR